MNTRSEDTLSVIFITDHKAGHLSQLRGLEQRLLAKRETNSRLLGIDDAKKLLKQIRQGARTLTPTTDAQIVVGAGRQTHKYILGIAKKMGAMSCVLMTPHGIRKSRFNAIICPKHDQTPEQAHILQTQGVLNNVVPPSQSASPKNQEASDTPHSLMLIGGPSKHYHWSTTRLLQQIIEICRHQPDIHWQVFTSRRTPGHFVERIAKMQNEHLTLHLPNTDQADDLRASLQAAGNVWVTPDSGSMLYEALTAEAQVACFSLKPKSSLRKSHQGTKINRDVTQLIEDGVITHFQAWSTEKQFEPIPLKLWEADRAADWLLQRYDELRKQIAAPT